MYKDAWLTSGRANPWISEAYDPPFTEQSLFECNTEDELLDRLAQGWCVGQGFWLGELCFINQIDGGSEWKTIKQDLSFESISWQYILRQEGGREAGRQLLHRLQAATLDQCRDLKY